MDGTIKLKVRRKRGTKTFLTEGATELPFFQVWVSQLDPELVEFGLDRERIYAEIQKRLEQFGIPGPDPARWQKTPTLPCLGVLVHADLAQVVPPFYVFSVEVFFVQELPALGSPGGNSLRLGWCREAIGDIRSTSRGYDWTPLYQTVGALVEQFLREYLKLKTPEAPPSLQVQ